MDANDAVAGFCDGIFKPSSQSFWSSEADGGLRGQGRCRRQAEGQDARSGSQDPRSPLLQLAGRSTPTRGHGRVYGCLPPRQHHQRGPRGWE
ncbi:MAG: hypothetical protein MZU95_06515 [Desulfomicrobium escambiense]|nr:hypothetical protein [Desulfomicrobium escambiense]